MDSKNDLVVICNNYPFNKGEMFLDAEVKQISGSFRKVVILTRTDTGDQINNVPNNVTLFRLSPTSTLKKKLKIPFLILKNLRSFCRLFLSERYALKFIIHENLNMKKVKILLHDAVKAFEIKAYVENKILPGILDQFVVYSYWQNAAALSAVLLCQGNENRKSICRTHGADLYMYRNADNYLSYRHYISTYIDRLFFISEDGMNYQQKILGGNSYPSFVLSRLGILKLEKDQPRKESAVKTIVSCSNLVALKRVELIIKALSGISDMEVRWIHFGDGPMRKELEELARVELAERSNVSLAFKGFTKNSDIHKFYASNRIDVFVNVSQFEGVPVSIMEAMIYGIPAIATDVGGTAELVNSSNGILIEKDFNTEDLTSKIKGILSLKETTLENLKSQARATVLKNYNALENYRSFTEQILSLYKN